MCIFGQDLLEVIKIFYRHRDIVLRGEEETVDDLAAVLGVGGLHLGVVVVVLEPGLHLSFVQTRNNFVDNVLKRLVSPATNNTLVRVGTDFMTTVDTICSCWKFSECHSMNWHRPVAPNTTALRAVILAGRDTRESRGLETHLYANVSLFAKFYLVTGNIRCQNKTFLFPAKYP